MLDVGKGQFGDGKGAANVCVSYMSLFSFCVPPRVLCNTNTHTYTHTHTHTLTSLQGDQIAADAGAPSMLALMTVSARAEAT